MTRHFLKSSTSLAASIALLMAGSALADTVIMNDGTKIDGTVISETDEKVVIQVRVGGILDEKHISASEVKGVIMQTPEQKMWATSRAMVPTPDLQGVDFYDEEIGKLEPFLKKFPTGEFSKEAREQLETLEAEKEKVQQGGLKLDGLWVTTEEYEQRKYWIDAEKVLVEMNLAIDEGRVVRALRAFDQLENEYGDSGAYSEALTEVRPVLERYDRELRTAISRSVDLDERIKAATQSMTGSEKRVTEQTIRRRAAAAEKRTKKEEDQDVKWLTPNEYDAKLLKDIRGTVKEELDRVVALNPAVIEQRSELLQRIEKTLYEGRLDTAADLKERHADKLEGAAYLETINALEARLREEKKNREQSEVVIKIDEKTIAKAASEEQSTDQEEEAAAEPEKAPVKEVSSWGDAADADAEEEEGGISMVTVGIIVLLVVLAGAVVSNMRKKNQGNDE